MGFRGFSGAARRVLLLLGVALAVGADSARLPGDAAPRDETSEPRDHELAFHRSEQERLLVEQTELTKQIIETQVRLQLLETQIEREKLRYEDIHLKTSVQSALPSPRDAV